VPKFQRRRRRYRIELPLRYQIKIGSRLSSQGVGRTCNISSDGVMFEADHPLNNGKFVKLSLEWPALLDGIHQMILVVDGTIVRTHGRRTAVRVIRTEFRIRGRKINLRES
jgi:PilZ domain